MNYREWLVGQALAGVVTRGYRGPSADDAANVVLGLVDALLVRLAAEQVPADRYPPCPLVGQGDPLIDFEVLNANLGVHDEEYPGQ